MLPPATVEAAAASFNEALSSAGVEGAALLTKYGVAQPLARLGVAAPLQPLAVALALLLLALLLLCSLCCCCCGRRGGRHGEPLLPKYVERSDGRPCRASAYCAMANDIASSAGCMPTKAAAGGGTIASKILADGGSAMSHPTDAAPVVVPPPRPVAAPRPVVVRSPDETRSNAAVASADTEGGRGGGWGDLDGMPETLTISRHEYPTSRRGADLAKYFEDEVPPMRSRGRSANGENAPPPNRRGGGGGGAGGGGGGHGGMAPRGGGGGGRRR